MKKIILFISVLFSLCAEAQNSQYYILGGRRIFNAMYYGAKGDGIVRYTASTNGTTTVTCSDCGFTSTLVDAGKIMHINGAGSAGVRYTDTIVTITDASHAVIKHTPPTNVSSKMIDYGTDDVPFIQKTIQAAFDGGGGVAYLPNPINQFYDLALPFRSKATNGVDTVNNCQLYLPLDTGRMNGRTVVLEGEVPPFYPEAGQDGTLNQPPWRGPVLYSTVTSGSGAPAIIGSAFYNNGFSNGNFATWFFRNLCVRAYNGTNGDAVQGNRHGINLTNCSKACGDQLMIDHSCPPGVEIAPTATIGILGPSVFNFAEFNFGRVFVVGYETAVTLGEHEHFDYLTVNVAKYGIQVNSGTAMVSVTYFQCEAMAYGIRQPSGSTGNYLFIGNYVAEHDAGPAWATFVQDVFIDPSINKQVTVLAAQIGGSPTLFSTNDPTKCKIKYVNQNTTETVDIDNWIQTLTDSVSGTMTIDLYGGKKATWTFGAGNRTISAFKNMGAGDELILFVQQDATGSRTLTFPTPKKVSGSIATGASTWSKISVIFDGTTYFISITNPT